MANDPHRDLLPVKEENVSKSDKGVSEKIDYQILAKLPRCELEDRFLRLLDEKTQLKKVTNFQDEKIKRLGTKLLRLINEKRNGKKFLEQSKEVESVHLKLIELEHENYTLKDKNIVLKQQLANHSHQITVHHSPVRSNHSSPLMSVRQVAPQHQGEIEYDSAGKNNTAEAQLQTAKVRIKELKEEIKSLHKRIDSLQQNLEKNNLDSRKTKVTENIELIRLQRSLKQQAIQISALQAQVKSYENGQKLLKEELIKAHNENDETLHLISVKQNEIINLCSKLEEKNLNRLQEDELKERINDLMLERDSLKERSAFLMKAIETKSEECEQTKELKKLLEEEKQKNKKLEVALQATQALLSSKTSNKSVSNSTVSRHGSASSAVGNAGADRLTHAKDDIKAADKTSFMGYSSESGLGKICEEENGIESLEEYISPVCKCPKDCFVNLEPENKDTEDKGDSKDTDNCSEKQECRNNMEKIMLERELQYLREMLRTQTSRCETQQVEINRLTYELRLNEEKCNDTLQRLELQLKTFQNLENRAKLDNLSSSILDGVPKQLENFIKVDFDKPRKSADSKESSMNSRKNSKIINLSDNSIKQISRDDSVDTVSDGSRNKKPFESEAMTKRFVEQVFLESSDEENTNEKPFERRSFIRKLEELELEDNTPFSMGKMSDGSANKGRGESLSTSPTSPLKSGNYKRRFSSGSFTPKLPTTLSSQLFIKNLPKKQDSPIAKPKLRLSNHLRSRPQHEVVITILWLKLEGSSSLWKNNQIKLLFVDFSFLHVKGEEAETPDSLPKPKNPEEKCFFNFSKRIEINESERDMLKSVLSKPDLDLVVFKVVSDPEEAFDDTECEDVGVAVITVKQFMENIGKEPFQIQVKNTENIKEVLGTLSVSIDVSPGLF